MKTLSLFASLVIGTLLLGSCQKEEAQPQIELIKDGNIEKNPTADWFFGYYYDLRTNPNNYKSARTTESAASASNSLKISCDTVKNDTTFCYFSQTITPVSIATGTKLTLKAKVKTVNLRGKGLSMTLIGYKNNNIRPITVFSPSTSIPATGTSDFTEYSLVLDNFPGGVDIITVYLFYEAKTTGTAYFDDVSLRLN